MKPLEHRYDMQLIFDCADGNPNGDPDAGNMPRVDPETLQGLVSDVCQKRKVRDWVYIELADGDTPKPGYDIFFGHAGLPERQILNPQIAEAHLASLTEEERAEYEATPVKKREEKLKALSQKHAKDARGYLCRTRFDIRTFGAVLSTGLNAGQVRGPVQATFARSVDPVVAVEAAITRKAVSREEDAREQIAKDGIITGTMGRKNLIPYGLYVSHWFVNPKLAHQTGFDRDDLRVLCDAILGMFEADRSASRGMMATRALHVFRHDSELGNARAHQLFERIDIARIDAAKPPRSYRDYRVTVDREALPDGIAHFDLCDPADYQRFFA